ncbi:hypothetical protein EEL30_00515 (plasmid) [Brevibacillus laterosporus]|uniref:Uncharacterized protein n=1 Tax=Brevibacillus laterosporus TaxID=1465 RepID=A0A518V1W8_BRELA|nr:hypothetical protein EEL30_00515 [Brevibacillus laterosporus]
MSKADKFKNLTSKSESNSARDNAAQLINLAANPAVPTESSQANEESVQNKIESEIPLDPNDSLHDLFKKYEKTVEDNTVRSTFLIRKDLAKWLDKISKGKKRGFKTAFLTQLLEKAKKEYEENNK